MELAELILKIRCVAWTESRNDVDHLFWDIAMDQITRTKVPRDGALSSGEMNSFFGRAEPRLNFPVFWRGDGIGRALDFNEFTVDEEGKG